MAYTFGQLKTDVRKQIFPAKEASNLVAAHDQAFVDAVVNLQRWDKCLQLNHTDIRPACATYVKCGLTHTDAPVGIVKGVSVVVKPAQVSSGDITASKVGNLVTASAPIFTADMVGSFIQFGGEQFPIEQFIDPQNIWVTDVTASEQETLQTASPFFYFSSKVRINRMTGRQEKLGEDDNMWHAEEIVGPAGNVQLGVEQTPT